MELLKDVIDVPDMVLDVWERRWRGFNDRNGFTPDPLKEVGGSG